ncbi:MAG: SurA N-terminal domain-containing protein [bacterium]
MKLLVGWFFVITFFIAHSADAQESQSRARKKHKSTDTVGVINGAVINYHDFREEVGATIKEHKSEIRDTVVSDTAFTRFVNMTWDKLVGDIVIEQELQKRKLALTSEQTVEMMIAQPPTEAKKIFTDSATGTFDEKAYKDFLTAKSLDRQRAKIVTYYQSVYEQKRLADAIVPKARSEKERINKLAEWLKKEVQKAVIDDRRTAFGFY